MQQLCEVSSPRLVTGGANRSNATAAEELEERYGASLDSIYCRLASIENMLNALYYQQQTHPQQLDRQRAIMETSSTFGE